MAQARHREDMEAELSELVAGSLNHASFGYIVSLLARLMAQSLKARNGPGGILPGQFPIVIELINVDGMTQRELCRTVHIEQSTMANTLKRMERDGLILRQPCPQDGRQTTIHLSEKGRRLGEAAMVNGQKMNQSVLSTLDPETQIQVRQALLRVIQRLDHDLSRHSRPPNPQMD